MRVLVTGGAGFIGSHTVDRLVNAGAEVIVVDDLSTGKKDNINPNVNFFELSIESKDLSSIFENHKPDYVIHLAAQVSVPKSIKDPIKDCTTNILGCVNVLENCRIHGVKKIVYASSAAVYGNPEEIVVTEQTPKSPLSFYGISKLTPEMYLHTYNFLYGLKYTVLRYANVYGPRQDALGEGGVVSIFADKIISGESPCIFGDGEQTRDFIYVEDVAEANIRAMTDADQMTLNVGTGGRTSVNKLYSVMVRIAGSNVEPVYKEPRDGDIKHSCMDITKITKSLSWKPKFSLEEGLAKTIEFYKKHP